MGFIEPAGAPAPSSTPAPALGFAQLPVISGAPSGVPTTHDGFVPVAFDQVNLKLWVYAQGQWQSATLG